MSRDKKQAALRRLMEKHGLRSPDVAGITLYKPQYIRAMMCGQKEVPERALRMLSMHFGNKERE